MKQFTKVYFTALLISTVFIFIAYSGCSLHTEPKDKSKDKTSVASAYAFEFKANMRKLWEDHIVWTRNVIFCLVDSLSGRDQAIKRLLQNQVDIGNAIIPYYGAEAGKKLTALLSIHINISAVVIKATKDNDTAALNEANKKWYANADEISEFLSKLNSNWALADMKVMMNGHLKLTTEEVKLRVKKDYDADVIAYDKIHTEILKMSDMLTDGIVKQFSEKFTASDITTASK